MSKGVAMKKLMLALMMGVMVCTSYSAWAQDNMAWLNAAVANYNREQAYASNAGKEQLPKVLDTASVTPQERTWNDMSVYEQNAAHYQWFQMNPSEQAAAIPNYTEMNSQQLNEAIGKWYQQQRQIEALLPTSAQQTEQEQFLHDLMYSSSVAAGSSIHSNAPKVSAPPKTSYVPPPDSDMSWSIIASRKAHDKARKEYQKKVQNELNQINDELPARLNCHGSDCYDVYDNPEDLNDVTHVAPTGLSNEIDIEK